ncbi:MAG: hypothetical protein AAFX03_02500 [Pseudomonadota bacterium]
MKKLLCAAAALTIAAAPAYAATYTIQFDGEDGESITWAFAEDGTATAGDGTAVPYTWDEATLTVCGEMPEEGQVCATFAALMEEEGGTTTYTSTTGVGGAATLISVVE